MTEVTATLLLITAAGVLTHGCSLYFVWGGAASDGLHEDRLRERDLDSENGGEWSLSERPLTSRHLTRAGVDRRRSELVAGYQNGVNRVQGGYAAPHVLPEELHSAKTCVIAVRAGVVRGHHTRDGGVPVA